MTLPGRVRTASGERGVAMIVAMMAMLLLTALGAALVLTTTSETMIAGNFRNGQEGMYAADAALERAMDDLLAVPDWNQLLDGTARSAFVDGAPGGSRTLPDGSSIDLGQALNMANCQKTASCSAADLAANTPQRPWGANNPVWKLFAYGPLDAMLPTSSIDSPYYVVVMVADDPSENDGDPLHDGTSQSNPGSGVLSLRAEAFGPGGAHRAIEMTVARTDTTDLERGYTGQSGQDEQNRRARRSAVQSPGQGLTMQTLTLSTGAVQ
jgi:hypothetical protein